MSVCDDCRQVTSGRCWRHAGSWSPAAPDAPAPQALDVERLALAMHPPGEATVFLACMGSSLSHIEDEQEREAEHRRYHRESVEAIIRNYTRLSRLPSEEER